MPLGPSLSGCQNFWHCFLWTRPIPNPVTTDAGDGLPILVIVCWGPGAFDVRQAALLLGPPFVYRFALWGRTIKSQSCLEGIRGKMSEVRQLIAPQRDFMSD